MRDQGLAPSKSPPDASVAQSHVVNLYIKKTAGQDLRLTGDFGLR